MLQDKILQENGMLKRSYENIDLQSVYMDYPDFSNMEKRLEKAKFERGRNPVNESQYVVSSLSSCRGETGKNGPASSGRQSCDSWNKSIGCCQAATDQQMGRSRHYGIGRDAVDHTEIKCMEFSASPGIASFVICLHRKGCRACTLWNISDGICFLIISPEKCSFIPALHSRKSGCGF